MCRAERRVIRASTLTVLQANKRCQAQEGKKHDSHLDSSHGAAAGSAMGFWGRISLFYLKLHRCHQCNRWPSGRRGEINTSYLLLLFS